MKAGWTQKRLEELVEIKLGRTPPRAEKRFWDPAKATDNTWVSIADLSENEGGIITESKEHLSEAGADSTPLVKGGTLLVSFKLSLGKVAIAGKDLRTNEAIAAMPIKASGLDVNWLKYFFQFFDWDKAAVGEEKVKGKALNKEKLKEIEIPLPPLAEQRRIVALLDEAFAGIDEAKANAEAKTLQLERFIPSAWSSLLPSTLSKWPDAKASPDPELPKGWSIKTIEEISENDGPVRYGILQPGPHVENGVPYVRPTEIVNDLIPEGSLRRTSTKIASTYSRSVLKPNDVILTIVGTIGKVALVPKWLEGGNVTQSSARIRPEAARCSPDYLAAMLRSPILRRQFEHYRMGAAVTRLNIADVKNLRIPLPPLSMQFSIVKNLDSLKAHHAILKENNDSIYRELASLKSSILAKAFAGELTA